MHNRGWGCFASYQGRFINVFRGNLYIFKPISIVPNHSCLNDIARSDSGKRGCVRDPVVYDHRGQR